MRTETAPVILFPSAGCEPMRPMTEKDIRQLEARQMKAIQKHWSNEGVQTLVELLEQRTAVAQARACLPGATAHDGGQGFALAELNSRLQRLRWSKPKPALGAD